MGSRTRDKLGLNDSEAFLAALEAGIERGDAEYIEANIPRLEELIAAYQERNYELAKLQYRARLIRDQHEPPASERAQRQSGAGER